MADLIPWDEFEAKYAEQFPSGKGNVAKPLRMALGALIIQTKLQETQLTSIALSVFVSNLFRMKRRILYTLFYLFSKWKKNNNWELQISV